MRVAGPSQVELLQEDEKGGQLCIQKKGPTEKERMGKDSLWSTLLHFKSSLSLHRAKFLAHSAKSSLVIVFVHNVG